MSTFKTLTLGALGAAALLGASPALAADLRVAWAQDVTGIDPHKQTAFASIRFLELVYEPLVRLDSEANIVPALAASWEMSEDAQVLTVQLDADATFHDGTPVTSADVKASFERIMDEATGASARANFTAIESIDTPDDKTVIFRLAAPNVPFLTSLASVNAAVLPASAIAAGNIGTEVMGSGPFEYESWTPNSGARLTANAEWYGGTVGVDALDISVLPDETSILAALRSDQVDFAVISDPFVATLIPGARGLQLAQAPVLSYHVLQLNPSRGALQETAVRQAISCAVDRQDILDTALLGEGKVTGPLTMGAYANDTADLFCYERDLDKARALLAEAGYPDGFEMTVMAANGDPATAAAEAQVIQSQLAEVGIDLTIEMKELNVYIDAWLAGDFDMAVALNGGRPDPFTMYERYWTKAGNLQKVAQYIDDTLDADMIKLRETSDEATRKEIAKHFEAHLAEVSPWVWLYTGYTYAGMQADVQGYVPTPTGSIFGLSKVTLAE